MRAVLAQADGRVESPGGTVTGFAVRGMGLLLEPQFEVTAQGRRFRADFRIAGTRVLLEFDGQVKYAQGDGRVWSDLRGPAALRRRVRDALRPAA